MSNLKVSIVTVCFNAEKTISQTIQSVLHQDYPNIEYIIIDGASIDGTLSKIEALVDEKCKVLSEQDQGLYDALNKGINMAQGDVIGFLHADDYFASNQTISSMLTFFNADKQLEALASSVQIYKPTQLQKPYRVYLATKFRKWQFRLGIQPPHPGFFIKTLALKKVGFFRTQYKISGDFEWLLRCIWIKRIKVKYTDLISVHMRDGGLSASGWKSKLLMNKEILKILKSHHIYSNKLLIYSKYLLKIFQLRKL